MQVVTFSSSQMEIVAIPVETAVEQYVSAKCAEQAVVAIVGVPLTLRDTVCCCPIRGEQRCGVQSVGAVLALRGAADVEATGAGFTHDVERVVVEVLSCDAARGRAIANVVGRPPNAAPWNSSKEKKARHPWEVRPGKL